MNDKNLNLIDTGSVFVPFQHIKSNLKEVCNIYFRKKFPKRCHTVVKKRTDAFIQGVCAISYLQYLQRDHLKASGEVSIPECVLNKGVGKNFVDDFCAIADILRKDKSVKEPVISFRRSPRQIPHGYGVHFSGFCKISKLEGNDELRCRKVTTEFYNYIKEHSKCTVDEDIKEFAENYYKYEIDMDIANKICMERNGVSFEEAITFLKGAKSVRLANERFLRCRDAERDFYLCKSFNTSNFVVKQVYGRIYTPFHNIAKVYRSAVRTRSGGEKIEEAVDMKGAFMRGALGAAACYAMEFGKKEVAEKIVNILSTMEDPYAFAMESGVERSTVKNYSLSFIFSSISDMNRRDSLYSNLEKKGIVESIGKHADEFLSVVDKHRGILYMCNRSLNKILDRFSTEDCVIRGIYGSHGVDKVTWTNKKTGKGCYSLKNYISLLRRIKLAIGQHLVVECFKKAFGEDVLQCLYDTVRMFDTYTESEMEHLLSTVNASCKKNGGLPCFRRDIRRSCAFNLSILCQIAEGDMMFRKILPMVKEKTGCTKLITLHDAVYCPKSYADSVRKCIGTTLEKQYFESIVHVYKENEKVRKAAELWYIKEVTDV